MSGGTELAIGIVRTALEKPEGPTEEQVEQICQLSYHEDSRKEMQTIIDQVLISPKLYPPHAVQNALALMKACLAHAASEFVTFCIAQLQFMQAGIRSPAAKNAATPTMSLKVPLTPPESPTKHRKTPSTHLPGLHPTSPQPSVTSQMDPGIVHGGPSSSGITPPLSVLLFQKEHVARMTFMGGKDGLEAVLDAVHDLMSLGSPIRGRPEDLLTALTSVQHCLSYGSASFVDYCVNNIYIFSYLRRQSPLIKPMANGIFNVLMEKAHPPPPPPKTHPSTLPFSQPLKPTSPKAVRFFETPLPTPQTTPTKPSTNLENNKEGNNNVVIPRPRWGIVPSASLFLLPKDEVAMMSFQSEKGTMAATLIAVNDLKRSESSVRSHPDNLVQALKCVLYCLIWGSAPFVARCREQKITFTLLRQHSSPQVRDCANAIFNFLKDYSGLHDTAPLIRHPVTPWSSFSNSVRKDPESSLSFESGLDISKFVKRTGIQPFATGFQGEIWEGVYAVHSGKEPVAIKYLSRLSKVFGEALQKHLNHELPIWRSLFHKNISLFYGVVIESSTIGLVSPRYSRGNVLDYVKINPTVNLPALLQGIADGVLYLHAHGIIHGNIKCSNVMVSEEGIPRLIDVGVSQVTDVYAPTLGYSTSTFASSLRWSAPELIAGYPKSEKSDVYAFASTYIELITHRDPYSGFSDAQVLNRVKSQGIPPRPTTIHKSSPNDNLWSFIMTCWNMHPQDRPNIVAVRRKVAEI